jgi:hypothetical protein
MKWSRPSACLDSPYACPPAPPTIADDVGDVPSPMAANPLLMQLQPPPPDGGPTETGGARFYLTDRSDDLYIMYSSHGHTLLVSRADLQAFKDSDSSLTRKRLQDHLPIRLDCRFTNHQWRATPGDGFCGLHVFLRLQASLVSDTKQELNFPALTTFLPTLLAQAASDEWEEASGVLSKY